MITITCTAAVFFTLSQVSRLTLFSSIMPVKWAKARQVFAHRSEGAADISRWWSEAQPSETMPSKIRRAPKGSRIEVSSSALSGRAGLCATVFRWLYHRLISFGPPGRLWRFSLFAHCVAALSGRVWKYRSRHSSVGARCL